MFQNMPLSLSPDLSHSEQEAFVLLLRKSIPRKEEEEEEEEDDEGEEKRKKGGETNHLRKKACPIPGHKRMMAGGTYYF